MRLILALALLIVPAIGLGSANAAPLSDKTLGDYRSSCMKSCTAKQDRAVCQRACNCMSSEMKQHWTQENFNSYAAQLKQKDEQTNKMVQQLAAYCYRKARGN